MVRKSDRIQAMQSKAPHTDAILSSVRYWTISNSIYRNVIRYRPVPYPAEYRVCVWSLKSEQIERAAHTLQLACTSLEKSSADRFTSSHAKDCTCQISLPTFQHTRSVLPSD
jgi:hypothetical protein